MNDTDAKLGDGTQVLEQENSEQELTKDMVKKVDAVLAEAKLNDFGLKVKQAKNISPDLIESWEGRPSISSSDIGTLRVDKANLILEEDEKSESKKVSLSVIPKKKYEGGYSMSTSMLYELRIKDGKPTFRAYMHSVGSENVDIPEAKPATLSQMEFFKKILESSFQENEQKD